MRGHRPLPSGIRTGPALALVEVASLARGVVVLDAMVKRAAVTIIDNWVVSPGKYLILVTGEVAEVEEALTPALEVAAEHLLDHVFLPHPHAALLPAIGGRFEGPGARSLAVVETRTVARAIAAADAACKTADVDLLELHLQTGLAGKAYFSLAGSLHMIEAAVEGATQACGPDRLVAVEVVANPHEDTATGVGKDESSD